MVDLYKLLVSLINHWVTMVCGEFSDQDIGAASGLLDWAALRWKV